MQDRIDRIEIELELIRNRLRRIEAQLSPVEAIDAIQSPSVETGVTIEAVPDSVPRGLAEPRTIAHVLGLFGRTFLILCGAFLLRSLTDAGILPLNMGIGLGLVYAGFWLFWADRSAAADRSLGAALSASAATLIGYPLVWEATTKFSLLTPRVAMATLALMTAVALLVAIRRDIEVVAWLVVAAALAADLAIMVSFRNWESGAVLAFLLGGASVWFAHTKGWTMLRWPVAVVVDVVPLMFISAAIRSGGAGVPEGPPVAVVFALLALFLATYTGSFAVHALRQGREVGSFETLQSAACLAIALAGSATVARHSGADAGLLAWTAIVCGIACYGVGFAFVDRQLGRGRSFYYYTSLAAILIIWGLVVLADGIAAALLLCGCGVAAALLGSRFDRITLRVHSAVFVAIASLVGEIPARAAEALFLPVSDAYRGLAAGPVVVAVAALICYVVVAAPGATEAASWRPRIPALVLALSGLLASATVVLLAAFELFSRAGPVDPGVVAALRTGVLSLSAIVLAGIGARRDLSELSWLVYPTLFATGAKLLLEDLRLGRPLTLFISFALFGVALIIAPRLLRRPGSMTPEEQASN
jgi:hypothetical protein